MSARYGKIVDLLWSDDGDFVVDLTTKSTDLANQTGGDLATTERMQLRGWLQRVKTRLESSRGDWKYANIGAGLGKFISASNTPETADAVKGQILDELSREDLVRGSEVRVEVFPLNESHLGIVIAIRPPGSSQEVILTYSLGLRSNNSQVKREA